MARSQAFEPEPMRGNLKQVLLTSLFSHLISVINGNSYAYRVIRFILNNPLYKGVFILGSGTAVAQLIGIISMPIITRLYTPSDLGILAVYTSVLAIIGVVATLRYEFAYSLPKREEDATNLFGLCLILLLITTAGFALILLFGSEMLVEIFDLDSIERYLWFLLAGFFGMGLYTILNYWAIRQRNYKMITYTKINQGAGGAICKILLGVLSFGPTGLILGHIVSQIAGIGTLARAMLREERENLKNISFSGMKCVAKKYKSFLVFNLPASVVNTISLALPPLALLALYDSQVVGFYALAHMLVVLPGSVISRSMGQAYLGEASKMVRDGSQELKPLYLRTIKHLSIVAVPLVGIPALFAPFAVPIIFGEAWAEAGWYCWPLALMAVANFVVSPISWLEIYNCNHWILIWDATRFFTVLFGFYISQLIEVSPNAAIFIYSLTISFMYLLYVIMNLRAISRFYKLINNPPF